MKYFNCQSRKFIEHSTQYSSVQLSTAKEGHRRHPSIVSVDINQLIVSQHDHTEIPCLRFRYAFPHKRPGVPKTAQVQGSQIVEEEEGTGGSPKASECRRRICRLRSFLVFLLAGFALRLTLMIYSLFHIHSGISKYANYVLLSHFPLRRTPSPALPGSRNFRSPNRPPPAWPRRTLRI